MFVKQIIQFIMLNELTKAEQQVMDYLWKLKKAFVKDILEQYPDPKPAYNTVSTIIRILEEKGFIKHESYGRTHQYYPALTPPEYKKSRMQNLVSKHFKGSYKNLVSFLANDDEVSEKELQEIRDIIDKKLNKN